MSEDIYRDPAYDLYECPGCEQIFRRRNPCGDCTLETAINKEEWAKLNRRIEERMGN